MEEKKKSASKTQEEPAEARYDKEQILAARRYLDVRDVLQVVLQEGKTYTLIQVDGMIDKFLKGKVK